MKKGSVLPLLLILTVFLMVPLVYGYISYRNSVDNVRGARTSQVEKGLYVTITSNKGTWDLNTFLCKTKEECLESLDSGIKLETKSGGRALGYEVDIKYEPSWRDYSYLKIFVRPGWGVEGRLFNVVSPGSVPNTSTNNISAGTIEQDVVLVPVGELDLDFYKGPEFSD